MNIACNLLLFPGLYQRNMGQFVHTSARAIHKEMCVCLLDDGCTKSTSVLSWPSTIGWHPFWQHGIQNLHASGQCFRLCRLASDVSAPEWTHDL